MTRIAFFGHDAADAAVRRRVQGFADDGLSVTGFMMRRRDDVSAEWENVDLGRTFDGNYGQRVKSIFSGAKRASAEREKLAKADIIYARNLDMLATAFLAKRYTGLKTPVIYEALDVHRLLTRKDAIGLVFRRIEGALLSRTRRLVVSSPAFIDNHFAIHHKGKYRHVLVENRLAAGADYGPRPDAEAPSQEGPLHVGWIGALRCNRSLGLLLDVADKLGSRVKIVMHGIPALKEIPDFHARVKDLPNVEFHGRYKSPEDLSRIYSGLDVVWAGDFMEAGYNSVWLLPNRLYEGGYYAVPPIAPAGTQTSRWAMARSVGFAVKEDLAATLPLFIEHLASHRGEILANRKRLLDLPDLTFIQQPGELRALIEDSLRDTSGPAPVNMPQFSTTAARNP